MLAVAGMDMSCFGSFLWFRHDYDFHVAKGPTIRYPC